MEGVDVKCLISTLQKVIAGVREEIHESNRRVHALEIQVARLMRPMDQYFREELARRVEHKDHYEQTTGCSVSQLDQAQNNLYCMFENLEPEQQQQTANRVDESER